MLSKKYRLTSSEVKYILEKTKDLKKSLFFSVKKLLNESKNDRFCVITPKKVFKTAVHRHFIKRKIYSLLKINSQKDKHYDYIIFVNNDIKDQRIEKIKEELAKILN